MPEDQLVNQLEPTVPPPLSSPKNPPVFVYFIYALVVTLGVVTGYWLSQKSKSGSSVLTTGKDIVNTATEVGSKDTQTFRDSATGTLEAGGFNGTGTHKLIREGGNSQTVYLISSILDLDQYVGKKVEIWGETMKSQKVGWLMDVGRLKLIE